MFGRTLLLVASLLCVADGRAEGLSAARLGVIYNLEDGNSRQVAAYYAQIRHIPPENVVGIRLPIVAVISPETFTPIREATVNRLPSSVQSLLLVWSKPWAVGCMSVTTAFAAGYRPQFCSPGCARTAPNPLFDSDGWLPADSVGWWPAMLLPADDLQLARAVVERGIAADAGTAPGTLYLVVTSDVNRNVRAATYGDIKTLVSHRLPVAILTAPVVAEVRDAIGYFTGAVQVEEIGRIHFDPGAIADHLTSTGGLLEGGRQMSALAWLEHGATASFGAVSEPCNFAEKFPNVEILFNHYSHGETILESYWKSLAMPGQGLFIGEPLSRPYARSRQ